MDTVEAFEELEGEEGFEDGFEDGFENDGDGVEEDGAEEEEDGEPAARQATPEDAEELTRLRGIMIEAGGPILDDAWREPCVETLRTALADPDGSLQAFVVDASDAEGVLASCSIGLIQQRLPSPHNPVGMIGYILNVVTDPDYRRQGHARATVVATLEWLRGCGIERVDLHASPDGEPLYRELGFNDSRSQSLTLWMNR